MTNPGDDGQPGLPFGSDYAPDEAAPQPGARVRRRVQRQIEELSTNRTNPVSQRQLVRAVSSRYQERRGRRLDTVADARGLDVLLVADEILVTEQTWADPGARGYLERQGLSEAELGCPDLESRLVRLVTSEERTAQELDDVATELRSRGFAASLTHITPCSPVIKSRSLGGPAPAESLAPWAEYPVVDAGTGAVARVAVIDTGIAGAPRTDGWLESVERHHRDDPTTHGNDANVDLLDVDPHDGFLDFSDGHGTFVSGIVAQVAPSADIAVYRALKGGGAGSELDVACAMVRAVKAGAQVLNLSLGCQTRHDQPSLAIAAALDWISEFERVHGAEVVVVAAAGNYGDTAPVWPAAFRRVVSVAAVSSDLRPTPWSSRGFWVDCSTIGEGILSTFVEGTESYEFTGEPDTFGPNSFAHWSGTSFAAPQVAGAIARVMHEHGLGPREALSWLMVRGRAVPDFGQALNILPGV
ncbi:S8 family peptidase [Cellulomonas sp. Leaf395]|uniref:S8 family peptidase n=1 Tax=Cellulomonas sp. Leaf395 TaxID=1736362 RepID=UPI0006FCF828|nr:S8 family serine peptidase [Cellulomonas sp. Leaf395]KQS99508.1 hypothetical protein ASG23_09030 [Cellulomonas sp. Leaf395]